jgi:hypothetical protein
LHKPPTGKPASPESADPSAAADICRAPGGLSAVTHADLHDTDGATRNPR